MAEQRILNVNMRGAIEAVPRYKRAAAASKFLAEFVKRHMKAEKVRIDMQVNAALFQRSIKNPPTRIRVICSKDDKKEVTINLIKIEKE
jgi:large subunit ribosomal protein L31e